MKIIIYKSFMISLVVLFVLINPIIDSNKLSNTCNVNNTDFNDSIEIDVCDYYTLEDIYPVMSNPIIIKDIKYDTYSPDIELVETPDEFSWNNCNNIDFTTSAKNQGWCGSCWAFGALGVIESLISIKEGMDLDIDLSEQYLLSCLPDAGSCIGGRSPSPFSFIFNTTEDGNFLNGVIFEECLPYMADDSIPCSDKSSNWMDTLVPISGYGEAWLGQYNENSTSLIKSKIFENGPVYTLMYVNDLFRNFGAISHKSTAYFPYRNFNDLILNHAIVIVGWKDDPSIGNGGYWVCKNSWDTEWGYNGYFNIEYGGQLIGFYIAWAEYDPNSFNCPPIANSGGFYQASVNEEIIFNAGDSMDAEGEITSYIWDFGDGTIVEGINPTHTYDESGYYKVILTVTDSGNKTNSDISLVAVDIDLDFIDFTDGSGLTLTISNPSNFDIIDCDISISISGGLQNMDYRNENIIGISSNSDYSMTLPLVGLGRGTIKILFEGFEISKDYFILGPYVFIR